MLANKKTRLYFDYIIILSHHCWTNLDIFSHIFHLYFAYISLILSFCHSIVGHIWTFSRLYFAYISLISRLYFAYISLIRHELSQQKRHLSHPGYFKDVSFFFCRYYIVVLHYFCRYYRKYNIFTDGKTDSHRHKNGFHYPKFIERSQSLLTDPKID